MGFNSGFKGLIKRYCACPRFCGGDKVKVEYYKNKKKSRHVSQSGLETNCKHGTSSFGPYF